MSRQSGEPATAGHSGGERAAVLSLYVPALILGLGSSIATPALPLFTKSFDVSFGAASLVIIVNSLGSAAATLPTGYLLDRVGRRRVVLAGPLLVALSSVLVATAQSFPELLVYRFLGGWATQMWLMARLTMIADTGGGRRGRQVTGMFAMDATGRLVGPAIGGFVAAWDLRAPFILHGVLALLAIIPSFKLVQETRPQAPPAGARAGAEGGDWRALRAELLALPVLILFGVQMLASLTRGGIFTGTLELYAVYAYSIAPDALGMIVAVTSVVGVPITFAIGHLMDRFGRKWTLVPGLTLLGISLLGMAVTAFLAMPLSAFVVVLFLVRASVATTSGTMQVLASDMAPEQGRGRFLGTWRLIGEIGQSLSPALFALFAAWLGYGAAFVWLGLTSVSAAALLGFGVQETLHARRREAGAPRSG